MRALAHPARLTLLDHLTNGGPSTATECAGVVELTPSATSYHLRALSKAGLVEEAEGRGDGRERFWRSRVASGYRLAGGPDPDPVLREAKAELLETFVVWDEARIRQFLARMDDESKEWQDASMFAGITLMLTAGELAELGDAIQDLLRPYIKRRRQDPPDTARTVLAQVRLFPTDPPLR